MTGDEIPSIENVVQYEVFDILVPVFDSRGNEKHRTLAQRYVFGCGKVDAPAADDNDKFMKLMAVEPVGELRVTLDHLQLHRRLIEEGIFSKDGLTHAEMVVHPPLFVKNHW